MDECTLSLRSSCRSSENILAQPGFHNHSDTLPRVTTLFSCRHATQDPLICLSLPRALFCFMGGPFMSFAGGRGDILRVVDALNSQDANDSDCYNEEKQHRCVFPGTTGYDMNHGIDNVLPETKNVSEKFKKVLESGELTTRALL